MLLAAMFALCAGQQSYVPHRKIDGQWLHKCNASVQVWRGVALRDLRHSQRLPHDLASFVPKYGLIVLSVPKVASSSCRNYTDLLGGLRSVRWGDVATNGTLTFALTRDPLERFVSASGTLWHRTSGDKWDTKGVKILKSCRSENAEFAKMKSVGKYSYASAANLARCYLNKTEMHGVWWNHHVAPQISYYAVLNPNTRLVHADQILSTKANSRNFEWECDDPPAGAFARLATCVHMPAAVHAMPMRHPLTGQSLVQRAFDRAYKKLRHHSPERREPLISPRMPQGDGTVTNFQEGRYKLLDYGYLLDKLGPGFVLRICRLYKDDYLCLELPAPDVCRTLKSFQGHTNFYDTKQTFALPTLDIAAAASQTNRLVVGESRPGSRA